jgi:hypothetical protein
MIARDLNLSGKYYTERSLSSYMSMVAPSARGNVLIMWYALVPADYCPDNEYSVHLW